MLLNTPAISGMVSATWWPWGHRRNNKTSIDFDGALGFKIRLKGDPIQLSLIKTTWNHGFVAKINQDGPAGVSCGCSCDTFCDTLASPIDCFCTDFALLALPWLGIAFRLRLATPSVESQFHSISWLILCYNSTFSSSSVSSWNRSLVLICSLNSISN